METYFLFFIASVVGGAINAIAGGGGLITFPLLMLVVGPMSADATSAVAGFASYPTAVWRTRNLLTGVLGSGWLWLLVIPSFLGGLIGARPLSRTGNRNLVEFVPWLILLATIIVALRPILVRRREGGSVQPDLAPMLWPVAMAGIFLVALYGGYFGAGIGILMIGALTFISPGDIRHLVTLKNFLNDWMREVAVFVLVLERECGLGLRRANGHRRFGWRLHRGNSVTSRKPHGCSVDRHRDRSCRVAGYYFWKLYRPAVMRTGREQGQRISQIFRVIGNQ